MICRVFKTVALFCLCKYRWNKKKYYVWVIFVILQGNRLSFLLKLHHRIFIGLNYATSWIIESLQLWHGTSGDLHSKILHARPLWRSNCLHFHAGFGKNWPNNRLVLPLGLRLDPRLGTATFEVWSVKLSYVCLNQSSSFNFSTWSQVGLT